MNAFVSRATGLTVQLNVRFIRWAGTTSKPTHDAQLENAKIRLGALRTEPSKNAKLMIHGLYQQATIGKCDAPKPGLFDFSGKAKWSAWNSLGDMNRTDAQNAYINLVNELVGQEPDPAAGNPDTGTQYEGYDITRDKKNKIYTIRLNRPAKKKCDDPSVTDAQNAYINLVNELVGQEPDPAAGNPDTGTQYEGYDITRDKKNKIYTIRLNRPAKKKCDDPSVVHIIIVKTDAQNAYINLVNELVGQEPDPAAGNPETGTQYEGYDITRDKKNKIYTIRLNRPAKKNAVTLQMYRDFAKCLREAADNDAYSIVVLTGTGDHYCSGNDFTNFANLTPDRVPEMAKEGRLLLSNFVNSLIEFPKPLVSLVNGPAVGISVTALGLCDAVYASDKATFHTPVSALCQSPDACSSYVFPKLMGPVKANELLMFNRKITAKEAKERNLVSEVIPDELFERETTEKMKQYAKLPPHSMRLSKIMNRYVELETLKKVNEQECKLLEERWKSQEYMKAVMDLINESKLKTKKDR